MLQKVKILAFFLQQYCIYGGFNVSLLIQQGIYYIDAKKRVGQAYRIYFGS